MFYNLSVFKFMIKPEQKKASKEFINYLKDTQKMPLSQTQPSKPK